MRDQRDLEQATTPVTDLSALLAHPAFQQGVQAAQELFFDQYEEAPLTTEETVRLMERNLSAQVFKRDRKDCQLMGWEPVCPLYLLGFVVGTIDQGLTYAPELQQLASLAQAGALGERQQTEQPAQVA